MKQRLMNIAAVMVTVLATGLFGFASPAQAAATYEWNTAVAATPPTGLPCIEEGGAKACWQQDGDTMWVKDIASDGWSATFSWEVVEGNYRLGSCVNKLGYNRWGKCAKNFIEGVDISMQACVYGASSNTWHGCSPTKWVIA